MKCAKIDSIHYGVVVIFIEMIVLLGLVFGNYPNGDESLVCRDSCFKKVN